ncbi:hypothetical protein LQG66_14405 [Bradyrhizobium ontarionense]|uniref:Uncharacterized protein n=1 Tax=Bradyrhizobium ontarionense TaxID=2898149 RepID=A0ABY3RKJ1_9BRAD|nr:hypothetical protein [Bradyrhizobium sp. A19]UFZ07425.1 hypothetical protein LQG66_14405 [Bradyrhizobium sp. A19]
MSWPPGQGRAEILTAPLIGPAVLNLGLCPYSYSLSDDLCNDDTGRQASGSFDRGISQIARASVVISVCARRSQTDLSMMKKVLPVGLLLLGAVLLYVYFDTRLPPGVQAKGGEDWVNSLSLVSSIISILGGVVSVTLQVIQHRRG